MATPPAPTTANEPAGQPEAPPAPPAGRTAVAFRSAVTGRFVTAAEAARSPHTHVRHVLRPRP